MHPEQTAEEGPGWALAERVIRAVLCFLWRIFKNVLPLSVCVSGKVGVSGEVEGMVIQVSASGAAQPETMKTTTACRLLL